MSEPRPLDINILPEIYQPSRLPRWVVIGLVTGGLLLLGLVPTYATLRVIQTRTAVLEIRRAETELALDRGQINREDLAAIEEEIAETREKLESIRDKLEDVDQDGPSRSEGLGIIINTVAAGIELTTIYQEEDLFTIEGTAANPDVVPSYVDALWSTRIFTSVHAVSIVNPEPETAEVAFTIEAAQ